MIKTFKIKLYPNKTQEKIMWDHIGACRYVWNYMLDKQKRMYEENGGHMTAFDMMNLLSKIKKEDHSWLYNVSNKSCQIVCRDLDRAYKKFFLKQNGFPKFKSKKKSKTRFPICVNMWFEKTRVHVEKVGKIKYKTDFDLPMGTKHKFINPRILNVNGKWMLYVGIECENQVLEHTDNKMGIDLGIKKAATVAYGDKKLVFDNINKGKTIRRLVSKQKHIQRAISRKYEKNKVGNRYQKTNNIERQEQQLKKIYAKITNIRTNYIHQSTSKLIKLNPCVVVMEDLQILNMVKNRKLSKSILDTNFGEWIRQMAYKCEWNGIPFVQANKFYPSSKTCHKCGAIKKDLKLNDRIYVCNECGYTIDRDYNAALNLMEYKV